jgi:hypothetical protein
MKRWLKRIGSGLSVVLLVVGLGGGIYVYAQTSAYDASIEKVYDVKPLNLVHTTDPVAIARGKHLAGAMAGCAVKDCHGPDLSAGKVTDGGPIGTMAAPNITNILPAYSDGELARLIRHGLKKDGRTVRFMPVNEFNWLSDSDVVALLSYLRTMPSVDKTNSSMRIKTLGKILDRKGLIPIDIAKKIDHDHVEMGPAVATPTAEYGRWISRSCVGCHGEAHFAGGPIPGAPPDFPVPRNLTPHETGLKGWTFADFEKLIASGTRKNGSKLADFMPVEELQGMDDVERRALWAFLQTLPPTPFGER